MSTRLDQFRIAMMLLTRLPMGTIRGQVPSLAQAKWAYPLVGVPVGALVWGAWAGAGGIGFSPMLAACIALAALVMLTGALHQDGLADLADGLGGGRDKAHCLEIMRDSRIGSYGVVALVLCMGAWVFAVFESRPSLGEFIGIAVLSRFAMLCLLDGLPPARSDGLGSMAQGAGQGLGVAAVITALSLLLLWGSIWPVLIAVALSAGVIAWRAKARIGGQTGDVCGATQFLTETAALMALTLG